MHDYFKKNNRNNCQSVSIFSILFKSGKIFLRSKQLMINFIESGKFALSPLITVIYLREKISEFLIIS